GMSDPGLVILPTHRLVAGLPGLTADRLRELLAGHFDVERVGDGEPGARDAWGLIEAGGSQSLLGLGAAAGGGWQTARLRSADEMGRLAADHSPAWRGLAVAVLHVLVLDHLLKPAGQPACQYVHLLREVTDAAAARPCDLAALVPPAAMGHVEQI